MVAGWLIRFNCNRQRALVHAAAAHIGPLFIRAGRAKCPAIYQADQNFEIGKAVELVEGSDVTIIATGLLVAEAIRASREIVNELRAAVRSGKN